MTITREELAAFADGELSGEREAEVAAAIAADPGLAREVEAHRALKSQLAGYFAPIAEEPVPEALAAVLRPKAPEVVDFASAREKRETRRRIPRWGWVAGPALAASLVLVLLMPRGGETDGYADAQLAGILDDRLVAEQQPTSDTRVLLSFRDGEGDYCRAFSGAEGGGIACRDDKGWRLETLGEGSQGAGTEYRKAGSSDADLLARAQQMSAGPALDAEDEAEARRNGWR